MNKKVWVHSLVAAGISGGASAALSALAMPDVFNMTHIGLIHLLKATLIGGLMPVLTLLKQSPLPDSSVTVTTTQTMESSGSKLPLILLLALLLPAVCTAQTLPQPAQTGDVQDFYAAGPSWNVGASPAVAGSLVYAHRLNENGLYAFSAFDAVPASKKPFTVTQNVGIGVAQKIATIGKIPFYAPTAAGITWNGSNTGWHYDFGVMAPIRIKLSDWYIAPTVRAQRDNLNGDGFHPIIGLNVGYGRH